MRIRDGSSDVCPSDLLARNLGPDQLETLRKNPDIDLQTARKGGLYYLGLNQKHEALSKPKVRQALKYLVDYQGMEDTVVRDLMTVHQAFLPIGLLGALEAKPFRSEEHTSELQSLMRISYAVFCLKKKKTKIRI